MKNQRRFIVLGGAGTIGKFVARDLFESHPDNQIVIADYKKVNGAELGERKHWLNDDYVKFIRTFKLSQTASAACATICGQNASGMPAYRNKP